MTTRDLSGLWTLLRNAGLEILAPQLVGLQIFGVDDVVRQPDAILAAGVSQAQLEQLLATNAPTPPVAQEGGRWDHAPLAPSSARASLTLALAAAQPNNRKRSLEMLDSDILARSTQPAQASRVRTYRSLCAAWQVQAFPMTIESVRCSAASLKAGHYRSAHLYYQAAMGYQARQLGDLVDPLVRATVRDCTRSIRRGLGPSRLKDSFDVWVLVAAPDDAISAFDFKNVFHARDLVVLGCWFMLREIELSAAHLSHLYLRQSQVFLLLPIHKTDQDGGLTTRCLTCACTADRVLPLCPWHAAHRHLRRVRLHDRYREQRDFPLVPDPQGRPLSKLQSIDMICHVLDESGIELTRPDEQGIPRKRFGGHCLRVSGAQFLSASGVSTPLIQLLGRWSSLAVQRYVQQAPLSIVPGLPQRVLLDARPQEDPLAVAHRAMFPNTLAASQAAPVAANAVAASSGDQAVGSGPVQPAPVSQDPEMVQRLHDVETQIQALRSMLTPPENVWIIRRKSNIVHVGQPNESSIQPAHWRSKCGWAYGTANFYRLHHLSGEHVKCRKCFPDTVLGHPGEDDDIDGDDQESQMDDSSDSDSESESADP
eukprot:Skav212148  [mRNA]  locus=scaffold1323:331971:333758:- [translate_table: standard]